MKRRSVLSYLAVLSILFASILGCDEKQNTSSGTNETPSEPTITVPEQETPEQSTSVVMEQFLKQTPSTVTMGAGGDINTLFNMWERLLQHRSMDIYLDVDVEGTIQKDRVWKRKTNRQILDEYCQDNGLVWKITAPDTIRIEKKTR